MSVRISQQWRSRRRDVSFKYINVLIRVTFQSPDSVVLELLSLNKSHGWTNKSTWVSRSWGTRSHRSLLHTDILTSFGVLPGWSRYIHHCQPLAPCDLSWNTGVTLLWLWLGLVRLKISGVWLHSGKKKTWLVLGREFWGNSVKIWYKKLLV